MASTKRRYSKEEVARRGDELYETKIRSQLSPKHNGMLCAIDILTGEYVLDADVLNACDRLRDRFPDAQIWIVRVGSRYVYKFGGHGIRAQ